MGAVPAGDTIATGGHDGEEEQADASSGENRDRDGEGGSKGSSGC